MAIEMNKRGLKTRLIEGTCDQVEENIHSLSEWYQLVSLTFVAVGTEVRAVAYLVDKRELPRAPMLMPPNGFPVR